MRLVAVAGICGCGKTELIKRACEGKRFVYIGSNPSSEAVMKDIAVKTDSFPSKSPCARIRQFSFRIDLHKDDDAPIIISEPPGKCFERSSPMLNPVYLYDKATYSLGPLITVVDGRMIKEPISKRNTQGLRLHDMINESDVIAVSFSDMLSQKDRDAVTDNIRLINDTCRIVFCSPEEGNQEISDCIFGDMTYERALYN